MALVCHTLANSILIPSFLVLILSFPSTTFICIPYNALDSGSHHTVGQATLLLFLPCSYSKANILKTTYPKEHTVNVQPQEPLSSADLTGTARFQLGLWLLARTHPRASPGNRRGSRVVEESAEGGHHTEVSLYMEHSPSPSGHSIEITQEAGDYN